MPEKATVEEETEATEAVAEIEAMVATEETEATAEMAVTEEVEATEVTAATEEVEATEAMVAIEEIEVTVVSEETMVTVEAAEDSEEAAVTEVDEEEGDVSMTLMITLLSKIHSNKTFHNRNRNNEIKSLIYLLFGNTEAVSVNGH